MIIWYALVSVGIVSLLSLLGAGFLIFKRETVQKFITYTLAFSSGVLLGSAFLDLIPQSTQRLSGLSYPLILVGIITFFTIEKFLQWHHHIEGDHHDDERHRRTSFAYMSLVGDGIHNFIDGIVIGAAYLVSFPLGLTTTLAVVAHEIPHELADFTVLIYGGFGNKQALLVNFITALTAIAGTVTLFLLSSIVTPLAQYMLPLAAGNFIYIAASDLIPELHKKRHPGTSILQILALIAGVLAISAVKE